MATSLALLERMPGPTCRMGCSVRNRAGPQVRQLRPRAVPRVEPTALHQCSGASIPGGSWSRTVHLRRTGRPGEYPWLQRHPTEARTETMPLLDSHGYKSGPPGAHAGSHVSDGLQCEEPRWSAGTPAAPARRTRRRADRAPPV